MSWKVSCPYCEGIEVIHFYHLLGLPVSCSDGRGQFQIYPGWELVLGGWIIQIAFFSQSWLSFGLFLILFCLFLFLGFQPLYRWRLIRCRSLKA